jgi:hypothetical protein
MEKEKRGGKREGAGRPPNEPEIGLDPKLSKGFASSVFARIKELKLKFRLDETHPDLQSDRPEKVALAEKEIEKRKAAAPPIESAEDYALDMLQPCDAASKEFFKLLLAYQLGKPVQPVITADTRETAPELDFGNLRMPTADQAKSRTPRKPN